MRAITLTTAALSAALTTAVPIAQQNLTNFLLVTTTSCEPASNSSLLPNVNATSLFDPDNTDDELYQLRLILPGYNSLPKFNLSDSTLHTYAYGPVGFKEYEYNSTKVEVGQTLNFDPTPEGSGNVALKDDYLLTVNGDAEGWTVCEGDLNQAVIFWKGNGTKCEKRYIQAVTTAPY
ncbi:uncharacterized protein MYCFIDRAFT_80177 [Pseudocercospora fijiensis CIRAD86]|uniref:Pullulan synthetase n=1 Tax=Pseudocercospora fijiensis (strain CIRAD86) TaxID=383855 RepID=N1Q7T7_PSEFD|nr:uncharacterized protein MYCFIDRAFT_80177 [Pseudocercospora fijiensis CIRAD86]EME88820.1 hypothetical protein MYCFIDRAFT_80177 [Pseudocercospora fijiensis CIRAD86]